MQTIEAVLKTLNTISVSGQDNLSKLLGCICALEDFMKESENGQTDT